MAQHIIDLEQFISQGVFRQEHFLDNLARHDFTAYRGAGVLIRGCASAVIPPWAFMTLTAKLVPEASSIRFGNEHDNIVVYRNSSQQTAN